MSSSSGRQTPDEESGSHNFLERANSLEQVDIGCFLVISIN